MKRVKSLLLLSTGLLIGFACGAALTVAHGDQSRYDYAGQVVGQAGETKITRGQLAERAIAQAGGYILNDTLKRTAFIEEAARKENITVTQAEVDQRINQYKQLLDQYQQIADVLGKKTDFDAIPRDVLDDQFRMTLKAEKLMKLTVTDKDVEKYYFDNLSKFNRPALVKLILISTATDTEAKQVLGKLKDKADPGELSEKYSADDYVRKAKGALGWVPRSRLMPAVDDAIFGVRGGGLKPKQNTGVIRYEDPVTHEVRNNIFYVEEIRPAQETKLAEVRPAVEFITRMQKLDMIQPEWFMAQNGKIPWKSIDNLWDPAAPMVEKNPAFSSRDFPQLRDRAVE